jgi:hypothetical protein
VSTLHSFIVLAAEAAEHETSKTLYYVLGGLAAVYAVVVSAIGIKRHETWPATEGAKRAVMAISTLVVVGAMASAIITAS